MSFAGLETDVQDVLMSLTAGHNQGVHGTSLPHSAMTVFAQTRSCNVRSAQTRPLAKELAASMTHMTDAYPAATIVHSALSLRVD